MKLSSVKEPVQGIAHDGKNMGANTGLTTEHMPLAISGVLNFLCGLWAGDELYTHWVPG